MADYLLPRFQALPLNEIVYFEESWREIVTNLRTQGADKYESLRQVLLFAEILNDPVLKEKARAEMEKMRESEKRISLVDKVKIYLAGATDLILVLYRGELGRAAFFERFESRSQKLAAARFLFFLRSPIQKMAQFPYSRILWWPAFLVSFLVLSNLLLSAVFGYSAFGGTTLFGPVVNFANGLGIPSVLSLVLIMLLQGVILFAGFILLAIFFVLPFLNRDLFAHSYGPLLSEAALILTEEGKREEGKKMFEKAKQIASFIDSDKKEGEQYVKAIVLAEMADDLFAAGLFEETDAILKESGKAYRHPSLTKPFLIFLQKIRQDQNFRAEVFETMQNPDRQKQARYLFPPLEFDFGAPSFETSI